jgi:hypothetical protein
MKPHRTSRREGAVLILALSVLILLLLALAAVLSFSLSWRQRVHKELSRNFAEIEARSLLLSLKAELVSQIKGTGEFTMSRWTTGHSTTFLDDTQQNTSPFFERSVVFNGAALGSINSSPALFFRQPSNSSFLQNLRFSPVTDFSLTGRWEPKGPVSGHIRDKTPWEITFPVSVVQIPLSAFSFYSSALQTVTNDSHHSLGRIHTEGDLILSRPIDADAPISAAGSLLIGPLGALILHRSRELESRSFWGENASDSYGVQGHGWIFERDSNPVLLVRPVSTAELFSTIPLHSSAKESQRIKPRCDVRIIHTLDSAGSDVFIFEGIDLSAPKNDAAKILEHNGDAIEFDLSQWCLDGFWPTRIWIESTQPGITGLLLKNAQHLRGDLSLATRMHIHIRGSFNTEGVVKKASLLTMGRVVSFP